MKPTGPRLERETIILFNDEEADATIWTASSTVHNRMLKRGWHPANETGRSATFVVPKLRVRLPTQAKAGTTKRRTGFAAKAKVKL